MNNITLKGFERLFKAVGIIKGVFICEKLDDLAPKEQKVLSMRFGLESGITSTLEEVAKEFGVTRERIRQIEAKALEQLRGRQVIKTYDRTQ